MITLADWINADKRQYRLRKYSSENGAVGIKDALEKGVTGILAGVFPENRTNIFYMLCFCLSVPQAKAVNVNRAIEELKENDFLANPWTVEKLATFFKGKVRFHNNKARYLLAARTVFVESDFWSILERTFLEYCLSNDADRFLLLKKTRVWLVKTFKGMGLKEASHFLRNVGMSGLAILDVHIINGLKKRDLIEQDVSLTKLKYGQIETIMLDYASKVGLTIDELDLLLWSQKTGFVFK